jgi:hypothetical protein
LFSPSQWVLEDSETLSMNPEGLRAFGGGVFILVGVVFLIYDFAKFARDKLGS